MKKVLSFILMFMLVFTISVSAVLADEATGVETEAPAVVEDTNPEGYDETTIKMYAVLDMADEENIIITVGITANDATLAQLKKNYEAQQLAFEEKSYGDVKLLVETEGSMPIEAEDLKMICVSKMEEKGIFADKEHYVFPGIIPYQIGSMLGLSQYGMYLDGIVVVFGDGSYSTVNGEMKDNAVIMTMDMNAETLPESVMVTKTSANLLNILIAVMILIVLALAVVIICLSLKNKKTANKQKSLEKENFVSEDEVFDELVDEAGIDYDDEEAEAEEEADDTDAEVDEEAEDDDESDSE